MERSPILALPCSDERLGLNGSEILSGITILEEFRRKIEPAGHFYETYYKKHQLKLQGVHHHETANGDDEEEKKDEPTEEQLKDMEKKRKKKKTEAELLQQKLASVNHYEVLGIKELGVEATEKDIKIAYRKMALIYHPDKQDNKEEGKKQTDPMWLKVQEAYETLVDPEKRRRYDSTMEFDDSLPEETDDPATFYESFGRVFRRNAYWSVKKPVPDLGDENTPLKKVLRFYDFWDSFESWRDFTVDDEYNLDEAENRYERRYMEKENKRLKADLLKKERQRIKKLVEMARNNDPRIIQARKEEEEKKEKQRLEKLRKKEQAKQEQLEQERKKEEERLNEERKKQEQERLEQEKKKAEREAIKAAKTQFKTLVLEKVNNPKYDKFFVQTILESLSVEETKKVNALLESASEKDALSVFEGYLAEREKKMSHKATHHSKSLPKESGSTTSNKASDWTLDELSLLSKATVKYPPGTKNRWECISEYMGTRSPDECVAKAKELGQNQALKSTASKLTNSKEAFEQLKKQKDVMKPVSEPLDKRYVEPAVEKKPTQDNEEKKESQEKPAEEDVWSQKQQQQLEAALKEFPSTLPVDERWNKIAEKVEGKTRKQCVERFKQLRAALAKTKK